MIARIVDIFSSHKWISAAVFIIFTAISLYYASDKFRINTDVEKLIDASIGWRQDEVDFEKAFPQRSNLLVVVLDGPSPEAAEDAASQLMNALAARSDELKTVYRPDGGSFLQWNGILLLSKEDLDQTVNDLAEQQALLGPLASDPTLRGVLRLLSLGAKGVATGDAKIGDLDKIVDPLTKVAARVLDGRTARMSWQLLLSGENPSTLLASAVWTAIFRQFGSE